jgi:hypothetical protein
MNQFEQLEIKTEMRDTERRSRQDAEYDVYAKSLADNKELEECIGRREGRGKKALIKRHEIPSVRQQSTAKLIHHGRRSDISQE